MSSRREIDFNVLKPNSLVLLAEGNSEEGYLDQVVSRKAIADSFVFNVSGEKNLPTALKSLAPFREAGKVRALGLMFDANADSAKRLQGIEGHLNASGFPFDQSRLDGIGVYREGPMPVAAFLSPGGARPGRVEAMIIRELMDRPEWRCVEELRACTKGIEAVGHPLDEKSVVQIAISIRDGEVCGSGVAFKRRLLDAMHPAYSDVLKMIDALAG